MLPSTVTVAPAAVAVELHATVMLFRDCTAAAAVGTIASPLTDSLIADNSVSAKTALAVLAGPGTAAVPTATLMAVLGGDEW